MQGFKQAWIGKAFEYAVEELFNTRAEPYWALMTKATEDARSSRVSSRVTSVRLPDIARLSCIRVCKESPDAEDLRSAFGRFRILDDARCSIENAAQTFRGLERKVDLLFCDRESEERPQFALMASLKVNPGAFRQLDVCQDFHKYPIDFAISVANEKHQGVEFDETLDVHVANLPIMDVPAGVVFWEHATMTVDKTLMEGERSRIIRFFRILFPRSSPASWWVDFLSARLEADIEEVVQDIRCRLKQTPGERVVTRPVLRGAEEDAVLDLVGS
jgi:hypothetical protein